MYKEAKVDISNQAKLQKVDHIAIKKILERQALFSELLNHIYDKLLDLDKKYEAIKNPGKYTNPQELTNKVSVNQIIFDAINITKNYSNVSIRLGLDVDIAINVNSLQLLQVLSGILQNSILFTRKGQVKIETFIVKKNGIVIIRICDTGEKFNEKEFKEITKFGENKNQSKSRLQTMDVKNFERIISSHNGTLVIKNNESVGVTFTISLPTE